MVVIHGRNEKRADSIAQEIVAAGEMLTLPSETWRQTPAPMQQIRRR
jgi:hypothetical protein